MPPRRKSTLELQREAYLKRHQFTLPGYIARKDGNLYLQVHDSPDDGADWMPHKQDATVFDTHTEAEQAALTHGMVFFAIIHTKDIPQ